MKFVFDYEEARIKRFEIEADDLGAAIDAAFKSIDNGDCEYQEGDIVSGSLRMPLDQNFLPYVERFGERVGESKEYDIIIHYW